MDFVVGIEVHLSKNHTCLGRDGKPHEFTDICDQLQGRYPKDFKFTGWHPHCRCFATSILKTDKEIAEDTRRILRGERPTGESENTVEDVPEGFRNWLKKNSARIEKANSLPYFIADNADYVAEIISAEYPGTIYSEFIRHEHYKQYAQRYSDDKTIKGLLARYEHTTTDMGKVLIIKKVKERAASLSKQELAKWGVVDSEMEFVRPEYNAVIQPKQTLKTSQGELVPIEEKKLDLLVYRDKYGKEFAYPIGIKQEKAFSAVTASEVINGYPPYLKKGIERVSFLDIPCPTNEFWALEYNSPGFTAAATDGGKTTFYIKPSSSEEFSGYMAHEAGHIIDGKTYVQSRSKEWQNAVAADDAKYGFRNYPTTYAGKHSREDFAESVNLFINDKEKFKEEYPNRAAFLRRMAQVLSGN